MELAFLVWVISTLKGLSVVLGLLSGIFIVVSFCWIMTGMDYGATVRWKLVTGLFSLGVFFGLLNVMIPSQKTAYIMVGAYATQQIAEDPKVQQLGAKTLKLIESKLDEYIDEAEKAVAK
jgi:hypothetical protein